MNKLLTKVAPTAGDIYVEPALTEDARRIWAIYRAGRLASQPNAKLGITRGDVWRQFFSDEVYAEEIEHWVSRINNPNENQQVLVAAYGLDRVLGVVWPNISQGERRLDKLYVARGARGRGIGSKLVEAAKAWHHYEPITLNVAAYNPALELYEMHGFKAARKIECGYKIADKCVPQVEMVFPGY